MRKVSEIICLAVAHPLYLSGNERYAFLCNVVETLLDQSVISGEEYWQTKDLINATLVSVGQGRITSLRLTLKCYHPEFESEQDDILCSLDLESERVKTYCRMFWAVLCMDLVQKGL